MGLRYIGYFKDWDDLNQWIAELLARELLPQQPVYHVPPINNQEIVELENELNQNGLKNLSA